MVAGGDLGPGAQVAWRNLDGTGSWQVIAGVDPGSVDAQTLRFDPTGRWLLWRDSNDGRLRSADLSTGLVNEIDLDVDPGVAAEAVAEAEAELAITDEGVIVDPAAVTTVCSSLVVSSTSGGS